MHNRAVPYPVSGSYAETQPLMRDDYEGMQAREQSIPFDGGTAIPDVLDRLLELYAATDQPDEIQK